MSSYAPPRKNWCGYCRALVIVDRTVTEYLFDGLIFETQRCTRCDEVIIKNDITQAVHDSKYKTASILVPDLEMTDLVHKTKVKD